MTADLTNPIFTDEEAARKHFESLRWPDGPECPHCGVVGEATELKGASTRPGLYKCRACQKPFTAIMGTVYSSSHIPLSKWLLATHLMAASKKGISAHQLWRMLGFGSYRTAWFMAHRIREGMAPLKAAPLGGKGKVVEADTTYVGGKEKNKHSNKRVGRAKGNNEKLAVHTLVERGGRARSDHVARVNGKTLREVMTKQVHRSSTLMTDDGGEYWPVGKEFARHESVNHSAGEYVRGDAHSNTAESYFATFKRGVNGTYHSISEAHLKRYLAEFDFRYNERAALGVSDAARAEKAVKGVAGKRLNYRQPDQAADA
jgi:transposase-like protein